MKGRMSVPLVLPDERAIAREDRRIGELEGHAGALRRRDFIVQRESTAGVIDDVKESVLARACEPESCDEPAPEVCGEIPPLKGCPGAEAGVRLDGAGG
jgi:hypothetical protein